MARTPEAVAVVRREAVRRRFLLVGAAMVSLCAGVEVQVLLLGRLVALVVFLQGRISVTSAGQELFTKQPLPS